MHLGILLQAVALTVFEELLLTFSPDLLSEFYGLLVLLTLNWSPWIGRKLQLEALLLPDGGAVVMVVAHLILEIQTVFRIILDRLLQ